MRWKPCVTTVGVLAMALVSTAPAPSAVMFPRLILFYEDSATAERYYLTSVSAVAALVRALESAAVVPGAVDTAMRSLNVAVYWHNPTWDPYVQNPARLRTLPLPSDPGAPGRPRARDDLMRGWVEGGRLYLPGDGTSPILRCEDCLLIDGTRRLTREAAAILRPHGVPLAPASRGP